MAFATTRSVSLQGSAGHLIDVQADVSPGVVATVLVGRPDASLSEGRDRIRMAIRNTDFEWPNTKRVTILLSPADVPKSGPHFDLAMAMAVLSAADLIPTRDFSGTVFVGELTLDGRLRPLQGTLPMVLAARARGIDTVFVPEPQAAEAALVPGVSVYGVRSLGQVVAIVTGEELPSAPPVEAASATPVLSWRGDDRVERVDLADVEGLADARFAVEVAAAGGHHVLLSGPKGAGKTTLAERIPSILPDLDLEEALELTAVHSLAGVLTHGAELVRRPPYAAPHTTSTRASLLGGGSGRVRPGEISRAHAGVLLLDEFPLFNADIIEALRQPLESGDITIGRGEETATFPARGMVVLACNPCPCGDFHASSRLSRCVCPEAVRRSYRRKIGGPIIDRIDVTRHIEPVRPGGLDGLGTPSETSEQVRARVTVARARQRERYAGEPWRTNGQAPGPSLTEHWPVSDEATRRLAAEVVSGRLTRRGATRVHRMAWTLADLGGVERPGLAELDVALRLRTGEPLLASTVERRAG